MVNSDGGEWCGKVHWLNKKNVLGMEVGATSGKIPGQQMYCKDSESLSGERILNLRSASQSSLDLALSASVVMMDSWWGVINKTWDGGCNASGSLWLSWRNAISDFLETISLVTRSKASKELFLIYLSDYRQCILIVPWKSSVFFDIFFSLDLYTKQIKSILTMVGPFCT